MTHFLRGIHMYALTHLLYAYSGVSVQVACLWLIPSLHMYVCVCVCACVCVRVCVNRFTPPSQTYPCVLHTVGVLVDLVRDLLAPYPALAVAAPRCEQAQIRVLTLIDV